MNECDLCHQGFEQGWQTEMVDGSGGPVCLTCMAKALAREQEMRALARLIGMEFPEIVAIYRLPRKEPSRELVPA